MKKVLIYLFVFIILFLGLVFLFNPGYLYSDSVRYGNLYFTPHKIFNSCMVSYGVWEGMEQSLVVEIPDEVEGHRVTIWGDHYPGLFCFNMDGVEYSCGEEMIPGDAIIVPRHLTIYIGQFLKELRDIEMKVFFKDDNDPSVFYQIIVDIHCSEENSYFYSNNGKLYRKSDNQLIDLFYYESDFQ